MISTRRHHDAHRVTVYFDAAGAQQIRHALGPLEMLEGALRGITLRWQDEAEAA